MATPEIPPFAYGYDGALLVTAEGCELLVHAGPDEAPMWRRTLDADVVGVGVTDAAVVAVDAEGTVLVSRREDGEVLRTIPFACLARDLAVAKGGAIAVLGAPRAFVLQANGAGTRTEIQAAGSTSIAVDAEGRRVSIGFEDGSVRVFDATTGAERGQCRCPAPVRALCWSPRGYWLASTGIGIVRVRAAGRTVDNLIKTDDLVLGPIACSADGALVAVRVGTSKVGLFDLLDMNFQGGVLYERTVGKVEFGPGAWLGVGLDMGDGNKVDLLTGMVHRTDPHEGRPRNRWVLIADPKTESIAAVIERARKDPKALDPEGPSEIARRPPALARHAPAPTPDHGTISPWAIVAVVLFALGVLAKLLL
jgi:hypothetical protein